MYNLKIGVYNCLFNYYLTRWSKSAARAFECGQAGDHAKCDKWLERGKQYMKKLDDINSELKELKSMRT